MIKRPEILSPAGNSEKLFAAVRFGADAVYLAGKSFGMRKGAGNFTNEELYEAVRYAHSAGVKVYVTVNTMVRGDLYPELEAFLSELKAIGPDALIVADIGVMALCREICPEIPIHVSTQASIVSARAAESYMRLGASRVVLARELNLEEIRAIRRDTSRELEIEAFVHGSMCISYSGRCLLSNYFTGRDGNGGACAQSCRWNYKMYSLEEEKRPGQFVPVMQSEDGTFFMSSRDMCLIEHIPELIEAGIDSFKIEGRMKSVIYVAATAAAYKLAVNKYMSDPQDREPDARLLSLLGSVTHRRYDTGYFFSDPSEDAKTVDDPGYISERPYYGIVREYDKESGYATVMQKNKLSVGESVRVLTPLGESEEFVVDALYNEDGESVISVPHPQQIFRIKIPFAVGCGDILR